MYRLCLFGLVWFFETGFLHVALAVPELTLLTRLASNSEIHLPLLGLKTYLAVCRSQHLLSVLCQSGECGSLLDSPGAGKCWWEKGRSGVRCWESGVLGGGEDRQSQALSLVKRRGVRGDLEVM